MAAFPGHDSPHPLLTKPVLYLVDPPKRVKWYHLEKAFNSCGTITSGGKNPVLGQPNRKTRIVQFSSVFHAEMALATLQGTIVVNSGAPWKVVLSHSPTLQPALPPDCIFPQYVRTNSTGTPGPIGGEESPQTLFKWFRRAGPLVSVRKNVNMGYPQHAIVVEYWSERDASLAQSKTNALHEDMHHRPAFTLRTYDSRNLYCAGLGVTYPYQDFVDAFSKFGAINQALTKLVRVGLDSFGFISFLSIASAAAAVQTMNGKLIGNRSVIVRYFEPDALNIFRSQYSSIATHARCYGQSHPSSTQPQSTSDKSALDIAAQEAERKEEGRKCRERVAQENQEAAERCAREAAEAKLRKREERRLRRESAERAEAMAREKLQDAIAAEGSAHEGVLAAESVLATANLELVHAMQACTEAKRAWLHAVAAETGAKEHVANVREDLDKALRLELHAERGRRVAEEEELSFRAAREFTAREDEEGGTEEEQGIEEEQEMDEESLRQAALAESIRKMEEINKIENAEKEEKEKKDREAAFAREERLKREREARAREIAERLARERDEAERVAREQREREEKQKRDAEDRLRLYQQAAAKECVRCQRRDLQFFPTVIWHNELAHERFLFVSAEFNSIKFQDSQPLTFESVPWPVLDRPHWMSLESIEWGAVEKFFRAMEEVLENETEYTALLEKAHRRFHPDKWKARGILKSILDQDLRDRLEAAGNVVAQAITPLWLKTRR